MMDEGLLKKRMRMLTSFSTRFSLSDEENIKINEIVQQLERINNKEHNKVIDEAKKEFPNFGNIVQKYAKGETWLPDDFPALEYSRDVICWFLRQFGGSDAGD